MSSNWCSWLNVRNQIKYSKEQLISPLEENQVAATVVLPLKTESTASTEPTELIESTTKPINITRIVGGYPVSIKKFPWQVALIYQGDLLCGGSVIGRKWVLTAAHCCEDMRASSYVIPAGSSLWRSGGQTRKVILIVINGNYNNNNFNDDIALMKVNSPWDYNSRLRPVKLSLDYRPPKNRGYVSGFGTLTEAGTSASEVLRAVDVDYFSLQKCNRLYGGALTSKMTCAGAKRGGRDHCYGDSGGPLVYNNILYGVVSFADGCARPGKPGVYTSVPREKGFIVKALEKFRNYK